MPPRRVADQVPEPVPQRLLPSLRDRRDTRGVGGLDVAATAALTQNFLLLAWERDLGTFWKTFKNDRRLRDLLDLADDERVVGWLHLGYPAGATAPTKRTPARERFTVLEPAALKAES